ncbi:flagellar biosynthesis anti-sigma factor FlgM [Bacillus piscicola]|uniref:flagellar biosynthesis anti-sigma factor FlgM n=1 Tax=Bacillus piscicola TaxID=1632684 RepID=UPI001F0900EB|nr:flagellar biosynthesis anti-sigma factor FlgM [Bacillus piscicola]
MKINPLGSANNPYQKRMDAQRIDKENISRQPKDKVEISKEAKSMQQGKSIDTLRQEKVERLKQQVESGEYTIDPKKTANKFYRHWTGKE